MGAGKGTSLHQRQRTLLLKAMAAASASCLFCEFAMPPSPMKAMQGPSMDAYTCSRLLQEKDLRDLPLLLQGKATSCPLIEWACCGYLT